MDWIKRNLFFVIGAAVALLLLGGAGYYNFAGWKHNADAREKLNAQYEELRRLTSLKPSPGSGKVDNISEAKKQQAEVLAVLEKIAAHFQPIAPIPAPNADSPSNRVSSEAFASALRRTIDQLQRDALNASVSLPPKYGFSFEAQRSLVKFAPGSLDALAVQLGEVKSILDVLNQAKVNSLDGVRRERSSADDATGPQTDYHEKLSETNALAVITPYEVTFRCFSPELAAVLAGFASSPNGFIVKALNVEPAPAAGAVLPGAPGQPGAYNESALVPAAAVPGTTGGASGGLKTVLNENQIRVTMQVQVVKLLPKK